MFSVNAPGFLVFMAVLLVIWYRLPAAKRWYVMLAAGIIFYLSLDIPGFFVLFASTLVVWFCARRAMPDDRGGARTWFGIGLAAALGPLLLLKYYAMMAGTLNDLLGLQLWSGSLLQPLGLAYYSLQLTGYLLDVRRGEIQPETRFARLLCYASFFLSITQGIFSPASCAVSGDTLKNTPLPSGWPPWSMRRSPIHRIWICLSLSLAW